MIYAVWITISVAISFLIFKMINKIEFGKRFCPYCSYQESFTRGLRKVVLVRLPNEFVRKCLLCGSIFSEETQRRIRVDPVLNKDNRRMWSGNDLF